MLNEADRDAIAEAVTRAEAATSGEIVCVLARQVSPYHEVPLVWAAVSALLLPLVAVAGGVLDPLALPLVAGGWVSGHASAARPLVTTAVAAFALVQAMVFAAAWAIASVPAVRRRLTPRRLKHHRVRAAALAQLAATVLQAGPDRAAVVIFASQDDRQVEVVASEAIHVKAGMAAWDKAVAAVVAGLRKGDPTAGFVEAVAVCGAALAKHFPGSADDANRVANQPLQL